MILSDIAKLPSKKEDYARTSKKERINILGFNKAHDTFSSTQVDEDKLREQGWVKKDKLTLDVDKIMSMIPYCWKDCSAFTRRELFVTLKAQASSLIKEE